MTFALAYHQQFLAGKGGYNYLPHVRHYQMLADYHRGVLQVQFGIGIGDVFWHYMF
jgi:hypothetical protein